MIKKILSGILSLSAFFSHAQTGGDNTYEFLNLPSAARIASMGGTVIGVKDNDLNLAFQNPSLLDSSMTTQLALNMVNYFTDINYGYAAYAHHFKKLGTFQAGVHFIRYGDFPYADEYGILSGENFKAGEYSFNLGYSRPIDTLFTFGGTLKYISSSLESYRSSALAADIAVTYFNSKKRITAALIIKNFGKQLRSYHPDNKEPLPFEIQAGGSFKPKHMPFRFSIALGNLQQFDLTYTDPNKGPVVDPSSGDTLSSKITFSDKLMRHAVFGGEFLFTKNFHIRLGYNYRRRKELGLDTKKGLSGMSFGIGIKISKFHLSYGRAIFHPAGASNHFSITTSISEFVRKGKTTYQEEH